MLSLLLAGLTTLSLLTPPTLPVGGGEAWMDDLGPALERARREGKDLLVDFTGSDWCHWCIRLEEEVFSHDEFLDEVASRFVLVSLDFPRDGGDAYRAMTPELRARNQAQNQAFGISGYPTVLLMTADGLAYGQTGYMKGGPEAYVEQLEKLRKSPDRARLSQAWQRVQVLAGGAETPAAEGADGARRAADREALIELMGRVPAERIDELMRALAQVDPEDSQGLLARYALDAFTAEFLSARDVDLDAAAAALERLPEHTPSVTEQGGFHFYRGLLAADRGDAQLADASLAAFDRIGDMPAAYRKALSERIAGMDDSADGAD